MHRSQNARLPDRPESCVFDQIALNLQQEIVYLKVFYHMISAGHVAQGKIQPNKYNPTKIGIPFHILKIRRINDPIPFSWHKQGKNKRSGVAG